jgi:hypothetical protein
VCCRVTVEARQHQAPKLRLVRPHIHEFARADRSVAGAARVNYRMNVQIADSIAAGLHGIGNPEASARLAALI